MVLTTLIISPELIMPSERNQKENSDPLGHCFLFNVKCICIVLNTSGSN